MDSWIPNLNSSDFPDVACRTDIIPLGNCSDLSNNCMTQCFGFTQELGTISNPCGTNNNCSSDPESQLASRYGEADNCLYTNYLLKLNMEFDALRQSHLKTLKDNLSKAGGVVSLYVEYLTAVNQLNIKLTEEGRIIDQSYPKSFGINTGLFAGTNCQPVREQMENVFRGIC